MKAIILAAGRGSRLGAFTNEKPKCMVEFKGKTLLQHQVNALRSAGIEGIAVVSGYKKEKLSHSYISKFFDNKFWFKTNMVYSLFMADEWLIRYDCLISYSDIFYISKTIEPLIKSTDEFSILYNKNFLKAWQLRFENPLDDLESFKIDREKNLSNIGEKVENLNEIQGQYMGLLKITPQSWKKIKKILKDCNIKEMDMTTMLNLLISEGVKIKGIPSVSPWAEIDSPSDLDVYEKLL